MSVLFARPLWFRLTVGLRCWSLIQRRYLRSRWIISAVAGRHSYTLRMVPLAPTPGRNARHPQGLSTSQSSDFLHIPTILVSAYFLYAFISGEEFPGISDTALTRSQHNAVSRRVVPGNRQSAALSAGRKTRMGQQGGWHRAPHVGNYPSLTAPGTGPHPLATTPAFAPHIGDIPALTAPGTSHRRHSRSYLAHHRAI